MAKLILIGDIHGDFGVLSYLLKDVPADVPVIQVGDFGIWPWTRERWGNGVGHDVYFIDGNHDHIPSLPIESTVQQKKIWPGAFYIPRGTVREFGGKRILFCGGSKSVDRAWRVKDSANHGWFEQEQLGEATIERAIASGPVDLMVTHTPPDFVIRNNFSEDGLRYFDIDPDKWVDESARGIEKIWKAVGRPPLVCGHMHRSILDGNVRILDINEVYIHE